MQHYRKIGWITVTVYQLYSHCDLYRNGVDWRLKVCQVRSRGIVPFVTNSPFMSFFYANSGKTAIDENGVTGEANKGKEVAEYKLHKNPEGKMVAANIEWHKQNNTYIFSYGLGTVICLIGLLTLLGIWSPKIGLIGGLLTFGMSIVTLSFLITTPEVYVPNLGGDMPTPNHGFPYLSGAGRLVLKDINYVSWRIDSCF